MPEFAGTRRYVVRDEIRDRGPGLYLAWDRERQVVVALSVLSQPGPEALAEFKERYRSGAGARHPHLGAMLSLTVEEENWFIVSEHHEGLSPADWLRDHSLDAESWVVQILGALDVLHRRGMGHGAVGPATALVRPSGDAVLLGAADARGGALAQDLAALAGVLDEAGIVECQDVLKRVQTAADALIELGAGERTEEKLRWVGRENELAKMDLALSRVRAGRSVVVRLTGIPGIGKTTLLEYFLARVHGVQVIRGSSSEHEQLPLKALDAAMGELGLAAAPVQGESNPAAPHEAAVAQLQALTRDGPVVFVIDATQWGDRESARLLLGWMDGLPRRRILWILAGRGGGPLDATLVEDPRWVRLETMDIEVGPLSPAATRQLAAGVLPDEVDPEVLDWVARESRGHPWVAGELAHAYNENPLPVDRIGFDELAEQRMRALSPEGRRVLLAVACAGRPVPVPILRKAMDVPDAEGVIDTLAARRWVRTSILGRTRMVALAHERLLPTILEREVPGAKARVHRALARELVRYGWADPEDLLHHTLAGGEFEKVGPVALRAAEHAMENLAYDKAVDAYKVALAFLPTSELPATQLALADAQAIGGRGADAVETYLALAEGAEGPDQVRFQRLAAEQALFAGRVDEATSLLVPVLEALGLPPLDDPTGLRGTSATLWNRVSVAIGGESAARSVERIDAAWALSMAYQLLDPVRAASFHAIAAGEAARSGDRRRQLRSRCVEIPMLASQRPGDSLRASVVELRRDVNQLGDPYLTGLCGLSEGMVAYLDGGFRAAHRLLASAERAFESTPSPFELAVTVVFRVRSLVYVGDLGLARQQRASALSRARDRKNGLLEACLAGDIVALLDLAADDPDAVKQHVVNCLEHWDGGNLPLQRVFALRAEVMRLLYLGRPEDADRVMANLEGGDPAGRLNRVSRLHLHYLRGRVEIAMNRPERASAVALLLDREAHRLAKPFAHMVRAAVRMKAGDDEASVEHLRLADVGLKHADMALHRAVLQRARGRLAADTREVDLAEGWLAHVGVEDPSAISRTLWAPLD